MESLLAYKPYSTEILSVFGGKKNGDCILTEVAWVQLEEFLDILKPAKVCTVKLQSAQFTASDFFMEWLEVKLVLQKKNHELVYCIVRNMNSRERGLFSNRAYLCCLFLDARCNVLLQDDDRQAAKKYLIQLHLHLRNLRKKKTEKSTEIDDSSFIEIEDVSMPNGKVSPVEELIKRKGKEKRTSDTQQRCSFESTLDEFETIDVIPRDSNILKYWETERNGRFHDLAELAEIVFSLPPTQVTVERCFSTLRFILHELRTRLSDEHLENVLLVKTNTKFFESEALGRLSLF